MRALLIGAVEGTRVAMDTIATAPGWELAGLMTLPPTLALRHSDYADLSAEAVRLGAEVVHTSGGNDAGAIDAVAAIRPDIAFVVGWSSICGAALIGAAGGRMVAYHPAALPRLRGRAAIPWTILLDEKITASTFFWAADDVDAGPILAQHFFLVAPDETAATLYAKHMRALRTALGELLPRLRDGDIAGATQDDRLATWGARRRPEDGAIDWAQPAHAIDRLIRAVGRPYPGAFTVHGQQRITVWASDGAQDGQRFHALPGQVTMRDANSFTVCCGDGAALRITDFDAPTPVPPAVGTVFGERAA